MVQEAYAYHLLGPSVISMEAATQMRLVTIQRQPGQEDDGQATSGAQHRRLVNETSKPVSTNYYFLFRTCIIKIHHTLNFPLSKYLRPNKLSFVTTTYYEDKSVLHISLKPLESSFKFKLKPNSNSR